MADPNSYQQSLLDAGQACAQAAQAAIQGALAYSGLLPPDQLPAGMEMPNQDFNQAATISSFAQNAAQAANNIAQALDLLQARPLKNPAGVVPDLYPATATPTSTP